MNSREKQRFASADDTIIPIINLLHHLKASELDLISLSVTT